MMTDRYDVSGLSEGQYQSGSSDLVLANKLEITRPDEMDDVELELLTQLTQAVFDEVAPDQVLSITDLSEWHRRWLGNVYQWAGDYRSVNMAKGEFPFAAAHLIPSLMQKFNDEYLAVYMPCQGMNEDQLAEALANVHIEYILIHPFREGNGRLSRLLAVLMALQADYPLLDFSYLDQNKSDYFLAIHAGLDNAQPMQEMFKQVLRDSMNYVDE